MTTAKITLKSTDSSLPKVINVPVPQRVINNYLVADWADTQVKDQFEGCNVRIVKIELI